MNYLKKVFFLINDSRKLETKSTSKKKLAACESLREENDILFKKISEIKPEIIINLSTKGLVFSDTISLSYQENLNAKLDSAIIGKEMHEQKTDLDFLDKLFVLSNEMKLAVSKINEDSLERFGVEKGPDESSKNIMAKLKKYNFDYSLVQINKGNISQIECYKFGQAIAKTISKHKKTAVVILDVNTREFETFEESFFISNACRYIEKKLKEALYAQNILDFLSLPNAIVDRARFTTFRIALMALGLFSKKKLVFGNYNKTKLASNFFLGTLSSVDSIFPDPIKEAEEVFKRRIEDFKKPVNDYIRLVRDTVDYYIKYSRAPLFNRNDYKIEEDQKPVIVTLKVNGGFVAASGSFYTTSVSTFTEIINETLKILEQDYVKSRLEYLGTAEMGVVVDIIEEYFDDEKLRDYLKDIKNRDNLGLFVSRRDEGAIIAPYSELGVDTIEQIKYCHAMLNAQENDRFLYNRFKTKRHSSLLGIPFTSFKTE